MPSPSSTRPRGADFYCIIPPRSGWVRAPNRRSTTKFYRVSVNQVNRTVANAFPVPEGLDRQPKVRSKVYANPYTSLPIKRARLEVCQRTCVILG